MAKKAKQKKAKKKPEIVEQDLWHDSQGKFRNGNPGGPGRPFIHQQRFLEAFSEEVSPGDWSRIIKRAVKDAMKGDRHARDFLAKWLLGMPEAVQGDERRTIIEILTDGQFVSWIESGGNERVAAD